MLFVLFTYSTYLRTLICTDILQGLCVIMYYSMTIYLYVCTSVNKMNQVNMGCGCLY